MDKRFLITIVIMAALGFVFLSQTNTKKNAEPPTTPAEQAGQTGQAGDAEVEAGADRADDLFNLETTAKLTSSEDGEGFEAVLSTVGGTFRSIRLLKEQYLQAPNEERPHALPETLRGSIPDRYYEAGQFELVSTWYPNTLPFSIKFDGFEHPSMVRRYLRSPLETGRIDPKDPASVTVDESEATFRTVYPLLRKGDLVLVTAPASVASEEPRKVVHVRNATLELDPPFEAATPVENVHFEVFAEGPLPTIFKRDQRYVMLGAEEGESVHFVWPDPARDTSEIFIEKAYTVQGTYSVDLDVYIHNLSTEDLREQLSVVVQGFQPPVEGGGMFSGPPANKRNAACMAGEDVVRAGAEELLSEPGSANWSPPGKVAWVGIESQYFLLAAVPRNISHSQCRMDSFATSPPTAVLRSAVGRTQSWTIGGTSNTCLPDFLPADGVDRPACKEYLDVLGIEDSYPTAKTIDAAYERVSAAASGAELEAARAAHAALMGRRWAVHSYRLYMGPKDLDHLQGTGEGLEKSVDFWIVGIIARPMVWLLRVFHGWIPHWGIAIILLTILVKLLLLPITQKSFTSMRAMQKLKPEMDKLRERYGTDKQKLNQETMALYKRHKVNPLGGCLPMLLQMPVYIALYRAIYSSVELYQAPLFGWIQDLSAPDPYFILPVVLGASMFLQQRLSPTAMDSGQAKVMMYVMPVMFTLFMLFLPSGLVLYIFVNTLLTLVQQWFINRSDPLPTKTSAPAKS